MPLRVLAMVIFSLLCVAMVIFSLLCVAMVMHATPSPPTSGVSTFKVYMSYKNRMIRDDDVIRVFRETRRLGAIAMVHAENGDAICEVGPEAGRGSSGG